MYYAVTACLGHQGAKRHAPITFYFEAMSAVQAMDAAKKMPGVKHGRGIMTCWQVSKEEYTEKIRESAYQRSGWKK